MEAQHWVVVGLRAAARGPGSPGVLVLTLPVTHRPNLWCLGVAGSRRDRLLLPAPAMGFLWSCYHQSWHLNRAVTWQPHALPHSTGLWPPSGRTGLPGGPVHSTTAEGSSVNELTCPAPQRQPQPSSLFGYPGYQDASKRSSVFTSVQGLSHSGVTFRL